MTTQLMQARRTRAGKAAALVLGFATLASLVISCALALRVSSPGFWNAALVVSSFTVVHVAAWAELVVLSFWLIARSGHPGHIEENSEGGRFQKPSSGTRSSQKPSSVNDGGGRR